MSASIEIDRLEKPVRHFSAVIPVANDYDRLCLVCIHQMPVPQKETMVSCAFFCPNSAHWLPTGHHRTAQNDTRDSRKPL
jgi:hypothetical protein